MTTSDSPLSPEVAGVDCDPDAVEEESRELTVLLDDPCEPFWVLELFSALDVDASRLVDDVVVKLVVAVVVVVVVVDGSVVSDSITSESGS